MFGLLVSRALVVSALPSFTQVLEADDFMKSQRPRPQKRWSPLKEVIGRWVLTPTEDRQPATLRELGAQLGVSRQYADKVGSRVNFDAPLDLLERFASGRSGE